MNVQQPLFHSSVLHDSSEILLCSFRAQETFIIITNIEIGCAA